MSNRVPKATLTAEQEQYFKSILTEALDELTGKQDHVPTDKIHQKGDSGDFADQASLETDVNLGFRIRERQGWLAKKIKDALVRLEEGTFGICQQCGRMISEKRLMARPMATRCITCKEKEEAAERMQGQ